MGMLSEVRADPMRGLKNLLLIQMCLIGGITISMVGPTLVSMQQRSNSTVTQAAYGLSMRSVGASAGAVLGE